MKSESGNTVGSFPVNFGAGSGSATITLGSLPSIMGHASAATLTVNGNYSVGTGDASLIYGFEVVNLGSGTATSVPIIVSATGSASFSAQGAVATGSAVAEATWAMLSSDGRSFDGGGGRLGYIEVSPTQVASASFNTNQSGTALVNTFYGVFMSEDANASDGDLNSQATASASVNSQIIIDPKFEQAGSYQIIFAAGVMAASAPSPNQIAIPLASTCVNLLYSGIRRFKQGADASKGGFLPSHC